MDARGGQGKRGGTTARSTSVPPPRLDESCMRPIRLGGCTDDGLRHASVYIRERSLGR